MGTATCDFTGDVVLAGRSLDNAGQLGYLVETGKAYFQEGARLCGSSTVFPGLENLEPVDVSHAVQWLASDAARCLTGIALPVDGGFTCK